MHLVHQSTVFENQPNFFLPFWKFSTKLVRWRRWWNNFRIRAKWDFWEILKHCAILSFLCQQQQCNDCSIWLFSIHEFHDNKKRVASTSSQVEQPPSSVIKTWYFHADNWSRENGLSQLLINVVSQRKILPTNSTLLGVKLLQFTTSALDENLRWPH